MCRDLGLRMVGFQPAPRPYLHLNLSSFEILRKLFFLNITKPLKIKHVQFQNECPALKLKFQGLEFKFRALEF